MLPRKRGREGRGRARLTLPERTRKCLKPFQILKPARCIGRRKLRVATSSTGRGSKSKLNQHGRAQLFRLERHGAAAAASRRGVARGAGGSRQSIIGARRRTGGAAACRR